MNKNAIIIYVNLSLHRNIIMNVEDEKMFHLIVTNDQEVVNFARERGAGIFTAEKLPEGISHAEVKDPVADNAKIYELLRQLDIRSNNRGYYYLKYVMEKCLEDPDYSKNQITNVLYPECAREFGTTSGRVERAIRHVIEVSFANVPENYSKIFGGKFYKKPTNSEFICLVSEYFLRNK